MSEDFPVVIAGGGPAGSAAALTLARAGRRVLLVDESAGGTDRIGEALPPSARPLLRDLGVLGRVQADGHLPCYGNVSAWGSDTPECDDFLLHPYGHGWHLDRARFDAAMRRTAEEAGAEVLSGARLTVAGRDEAGVWRAGLMRSGARGAVRCRLLIDATGRRGAVARRVGATRHRQCALIAIHARFRPPTGEVDRDSRTLVEAAPDGWWYAALVPSGERVVAYFTDADLADRAALLKPEGFLAGLDGSRLIREALTTHGSTLADRPRITDAAGARLDRFAGPGWLAVGDSALSFDPLSSQGLLTALYTGLRAGQAADRLLDGDDGPVAEYARRLDAIHDAYRRHRAAYYAAERRWADRVFWLRRVRDEARSALPRAHRSTPDRTRGQQ
jgi:flavin-dependent dehydrogenase